MASFAPLDKDVVMKTLVHNAPVYQKVLWANLFKLLVDKGTIELPVTQLADLDPLFDSANKDPQMTSIESDLVYVKAAINSSPGRYFPVDSVDDFIQKSAALIDRAHRADPRPSRIELFVPDPTREIL